MTKSDKNLSAGKVYIPTLGPNFFGNIPEVTKLEDMPKQALDWPKLRNRKRSQAKIVRLKKAAMASNTVPGPASIAELARALKHDVDLIYEWVYSNVEFVPLFGSHKSTLGTLIDRCGNSFEQSALMISLLEASGYTANFVAGSIRLTKTMVDDMLGTHDAPNYLAAVTILSNSNVYVAGTVDSNNEIVHVDIAHVWVKVNIGGTDYVFDPSIKSYEYQTGGLDFATATGYNETALISAAESGATLTSESILNFNSANVRSKFKDYGTNLLNHIRSTNFSASLEDIIGGRKIIPQIGLPFRNPVLGYEVPEAPTEDWDSIPNDFRALYTFKFTPFGSSTYAFFTDEFYGRRFTLTFNEENEPAIKVDGSVVLTGVGLPDNFYEATCGVTHPWTGGATTWTHRLWLPGTYFLGTSFGPVSKSMVDYHQTAMQRYQDSGDSDSDETVLGESLAAQFYLHMSESNQLTEIILRMNNCAEVSYHNCGIVMFNEVTDGVALDLKGRINAVRSLVNDVGLARKAWRATELGLNVFEAGIMQQNYGGQGIATPTVLEKAIALGQKIFDATSTNWSSSVRGQLNFNFNPVIPSLNAAIAAGNRMIIHESAAVQIGTWEGAAWLLMETASPATALAGIINGDFLGGIPDQPNSGIIEPAPLMYMPPQLSQAQTPDPITLQTGDLVYNRTDFSVGSGSFPYGLDFGRSYNSASRLADGPIGKGWTHNHASSLAVASSGSRGLGEVSLKEAAAAIAWAYVATQLALDGGNSPSLTKMLIGEISSAWLIDQLTNNSVVLSASGNSFNFVKLVDDSFNPPPGEARTLVKNVDGTYTLKTPQQLTWNFGTNGKVTSFVDPGGVTVNYSYNSGTGVLETVTNNLGRTLTFSYTGTRLTSVSDGNGRSVQYSVDSNGNLVSFTDPLNHTHTFEYALPGQLTKIYLPKDPTIAIVENTYDSLGRVMTQKGADTGTYHYFFAGSRTEEVSPTPFNYRRIMYWNRLGSLIRAIDPLGHETVTEYDGLNRPIKITMPEKNSVSMTYDNKNNVLSTTAKAKPTAPASDIVNAFTYDPAWNKVATLTDGRNFTTTFDYDNTTGRLLSIIQPPPQVGDPNPTTVFTYNSRGQLLTATDPTNVVAQNIYDSATEKLLSSIYDVGASPHLNLTTSFGFNAVGDVTSVTNPRGHTSKFTFDDARRLTSTESAPIAPAVTGFVTNYLYDVNDQSTSVQRQTGLPSPNQWQTTSRAYTITGMVDSITNPSGHVTDYVYDVMNRLLQKIDAENRTVEFSYDALGRISSVKDPSNIVSGSRTFTPNGRVASIKDALNNETSYEYDGFDRLSKRVYPDSSFEAMTYDSNGNVLTATTRAGQTVTVSYDALNRKLTRQPGSMPVQTMEYDLAGRLKKMSTPVISGDPTSGAFEFSFDTAGRLIQQKKPDGKLVTYELDFNGNRTKLIYPDSYFVEYVFDEMNRLTDIKLNGSSSSAAAFQYNDLSNRKKLTYGNGCVVDYGYEIDDDMNSLTHTFAGGSVNFAYSFDDVHQVKDQFVSNNDFMWDAVVDRQTDYEEGGYPINELNQYSRVGGVDYSYDGNGCLTGNGIWTYGYDVLSRLVSATSVGSSVSFLYDPLDRQGEKNVGGVKTRFVYDGLQRIADYDSSGSLLNRIVYGPGLDEPLIQVSSAGTVTYLHQDRQSSLVASTNASGALLTSIAYGPFGETTTLTGVPAGYTGQRFDNETGLYYSKARYYSPEIGRFLQPDPIGYAAGLNLYAYVGNSPVTLTDPLGLAPAWGWRMLLEESLKDPEEAGRRMSPPAISNTDSTTTTIEIIPPDFPTPNKGAGGPGSGGPVIYTTPKNEPWNPLKLKITRTIYGPDGKAIGQQVLDYSGYKGDGSKLPDGLFDIIHSPLTKLTIDVSKWLTVGSEGLLEGIAKNSIDYVGRNVVYIIVDEAGQVLKVGQSAQALLTRLAQNIATYGKDFEGTATIYAESVWPGTAQALNRETQVLNEIFHKTGHYPLWNKTNN